MSGEMIEAEIERLEAENVQLTLERDNWQQRAEVLESSAHRVALELTAERDAALTDKHCLRLELEQMRAEAEGLRADLLAHPPEVHQELAAERKRHLELMEDYDRQNVMIGTLEDAIKRTENLLKVAVDDRLKGVLASISKLANEAEEML